ncbi:MAG TPA: response regulator [Polaromonas sp.]|uniref:hybrid sensor histidine kinase/response regulator n=1 Tax=Polaromonas sp. TaxID=1869339 RepID=UPI002D47332A|nr:response regulator [Polaromonas sp.]HYW57941.1 response regulator [Polaromonas sp.]
MSAVLATASSRPPVSDDFKSNILVVDDLPEKHVVFGTILEELEQNVFHARSGKEALRLILNMDFAVILLDVNMPDIDGLETGKLIRQYKRTAKTPILFITAYVDETQAIQGYALGAVDYIASPVVPEILRSKVKVFVDLHRMNRQLQAQAAEREALARSEAARVAAEESIQRAHYLSEASQTLSRSLDVDATVQALVQIALPALADMAAVALLDSHGELICTDIVDSPSPALSLPVAGSRKLNPEMTQAMRSAMLSREIEFVAPVGLWTERRADESGEGVLALPAAVEKVALCPLFAGERPLGALLLFGRPDHFTGTRISLIKEVVSRASIAMENARLYSLVQEADRRKNEFLAMLAHELRNPLAPIRNAVRIMQGAALADSKMIWARDVIGRQVDHMSRMVDDLLDVSRIARGKVTVQTEILSLAMLCERAVEASAPLINSRQQRLTLALPQDHVLIEGDTVRLCQVLSNLLNNASKFTPPDGVIELSAEMNGPDVEICVKDNGQGIDPAFLPYMFDLFAQGDQALDRAQGGLGIGLTLVKHLVELHGGDVRVFSEGLGLGAEVTLRLPARVTDAEGMAPVVRPPSAPVRVAGATRVLVVDDLLASAETMKVLLESEGYVVQIAGDGPSALAAAKEFSPSVVILDIGLPGMSGFEVAQQMRQREETRDALLIALTGYGEAESRLRSSKSGFDHHVVKPADIDLLLGLISQASPRKV